MCVQQETPETLVLVITAEFVKYLLCAKHSLLINSLDQHIYSANQNILLPHFKLTRGPQNPLI